MKNFDNCFYCQSLGNFSQYGKCAFCGVNNLLYLINYQGNKKYFCCGCAWWQFPRSKAEKEAEEKWYKEWKNKSYQKFLLQSVIQCLVCGGTMKKKKMGYDCISCENFINNEKILNEI